MARRTNRRKPTLMLQPAEELHLPNAVQPLEAHGGLAAGNVTRIAARGYFYPLALSGRRLKPCTATVFDNLTQLPPHVDVDSHFVNPHNAPTHATTVVMGPFKYLVSGYFDAALDANLNLQGPSPGVVWRGEVAIFSLGHRIRVKSRPQGRRPQTEEAIRFYIESSSAARALGLPPPRQIVVHNGVYDTIL